MSLQFRVCVSLAELISPVHDVFKVLAYPYCSRKEERKFREITMVKKDWKTRMLQSVGTVGSKMKRKIVVLFSFTLIISLGLILALPRQIGPQLEEYYAKNEVVTENIEGFTTTRPKLSPNKTEAVVRNKRIIKMIDDDLSQKYCHDLELLSSEIYYSDLS